MPTYEYKCKECGHELEIFQRMTASPLTDCPECGKSSLKRKIGAGAGIIFKGNGFYCTDYRKDSYNKGAEKDKAVSTEKPAAAVAKSEPTKNAKD